MNNYIKKLNFLKKIYKKLKMNKYKNKWKNVYYGYILHMNMKNYVQVN